MKPRAPDGSTLQARIFRVLRDVGSLDAASVGKLVGVKYGAAHTACSYMIARGIVERRKMGPRLVLYRAVPGKKEPRDRRGKPKGCRNQKYGNVLAMMKAKYGPQWRPRVRPAIALEAAWPLQEQSNR